MAKETLKDVKIAETAEYKAELTQEQVPRKDPKFGKNPVYSAGEFAVNAQKIFGTRPECVAAALKASGKSECTISEAKGIVDKFLKREVK